MIELKPQLQILDLNGLKSFEADQRKRGTTVTSTLADASVRIQAARKVPVVAVGEPKRIGGANVRVLTGEDALLQKSLATHAVRQVADAARIIRAETDKIVVPVLKQMIAASEQAKEMSTRHWDMYSVLRRAKGAATGTSGAIEAMQLRAAYDQILDDCEPRELANWAQQAIDTGDPILTDCVLRENFTRSRDSRPFVNGTVLALISNSDYDNAQAFLKSVVRLHQETGLAYAEFERGSGAVAVNRIALGLTKQDDPTDEAGGVQ